MLGQRKSYLFALLIIISGCSFFWFDAELNWDESTFVVMADQLLKGNLPFMRFWDIKPPLIFFYMAGVLSIAKSMFAVRLAATVLIILMVFSANAFCKIFFQERVRNYLLLIMSCVAPFIAQGPWNTTEHLAVIPLTLCLSLVLAQSPRFLLLGICGAFVVMARTNLLPIVGVIFVWSLARHFRGPIAMSKRAAVIWVRAADCDFDWYLLAPRRP